MVLKEMYTNNDWIASGDVPLSYGIKINLNKRWSQFANIKKFL